MLNLETLTAASDVHISGRLGALADAAGITTVAFNDTGNGDSLTIASEFTSTLRINLDVGNNVLSASAYTGTLTVAITEANATTTGAGANTIVSGAGADTITTTGGSDIVKWTGVDAAGLATETGSTAGTDNDFAAGTLGDKVADFISGTDKFYFDDAALTNATGTENDTLNTIAASGTVANTNRFVEVTTALANGQMGTAITQLDGLNTSAVAIGDSFLASLRDASDGYLYLVQQVSTADTIAAQDLTLIAQITGVTDVANGDFVTF